MQCVAGLCFKFGKKYHHASPRYSHLKQRMNCMFITEKKGDFSINEYCVCDARYGVQYKTYRLEIGSTN